MSGGRISDAMRDAIRALQDVVFQETGQAGQLAAIVVGRELGKEIGLYPGASIILRGAPCDLRVTVESEALDVPLANRVAVLERAVASIAPVTVSIDDDARRAVDGALVAALALAGEEPPP